jgi:hypothetical protein
LILWKFFGYRGCFVSTKILGSGEREKFGYLLLNIPRMDSEPYCSRMVPGIIFLILFRAVFGPGIIYVIYSNGVTKRVKSFNKG